MKDLKINIENNEEIHSKASKAKSLLHMPTDDLFGEKKKDKTVYNNSFIEALYLNDCYGVSDKIRYNLTEGWALTKKYFILTDSQKAFDSLKECFYDLFCTHKLKTNKENDNSGVGINSNLFSGELNEDDCRFIPTPRKIKQTMDSITYKFDKQTIIITTNPDMLLNYKKGHAPRIDDIGFFTFNSSLQFYSEILSDYAVELKSNLLWIREHPNASIEEIVKDIKSNQFPYYKSKIKGDE